MQQSILNTRDGGGEYRRSDMFNEVRMQQQDVLN